MPRLATSAFDDEIVDVARERPVRPEEEPPLGLRLAMTPEGRDTTKAGASSSRGPALRVAVVFMR